MGERYCWVPAEKTSARRPKKGGDRRRSSRINMVEPGNGERSQSNTFFGERAHKDSLTLVKGGPLFIGR